MSMHRPRPRQGWVVTKGMAAVWSWALALKVPPWASGAVYTPPPPYSVSQAASSAAAAAPALRSKWGNCTLVTTAAGQAMRLQADPSYPAKHVHTPTLRSQDPRPLHSSNPLTPGKAPEDLMGEGEATPEVHEGTTPVPWASPQ